MMGMILNIIMVMMACLWMMLRLEHDAKLASWHMDALADLLVDLHLHKYKYKIQN